MGQSLSSHFTATGKIFDKVLLPSIPGFLEKGIRPVSVFLHICRPQKSDVFGSAKHKIKEAPKYH